MKRFDVAVIGGGPGGYVAAIQAAQNKRSVVLIEAGQLGGTCLNRGCIPTKTLVASTDQLRNIQRASAFGIKVKEVSFDYAAMHGHMDDVVSGVRSGLEGLIAANKITVLRGHGKFVSPTEIKVIGEDNEVVFAKNTIIATGSEPRNIPAFPFDHKSILSSTSILEKENLPKKLIVIGGGVVGCEFASIYSQLGVEVEILEALPHIIAPEGEDLSEALKAAFTKQGITVSTNMMVEGVDQLSKGGLRVRLGKGEHRDTDWVLVAVGRQLNTDKIGLDKVGINVDSNGAIPVNSTMATTVPNIYAIGDVTAKCMLAHVASHQGLVAAMNATGRHAEMHYDAIPSVVFTHPELASVGRTLKQAKEDGFDAIIGKFPFQVLGKSQATLETEGFAQIVLDQQTGQLLGAQVCGHEAATLIAEMTLAIHNELTLGCLTETVHAHPTISEAWLEAAMLAQGNPIHLPPKRSKSRVKELAPC